MDTASRLNGNPAGHTLDTQGQKSGKKVKRQKDKILIMVFHMKTYKTSGGETRTHDLRAMNPQGRFLSDCSKMVYNCKITTYDAGRSVTEGQQ